MISKLSQDELVAIGARYRADYVIAQGLYTIQNVATDPEVKDLAGAEFLSEVQTTVDKLQTASQEKGMAEAESKDATQAQGEAVESGKIWRRALVNRVQAALLRGVEVPAELAKMAARGTNPVALGRDIQRLVGLAREHQPKLAVVRITPDFLARGAQLAKDLMAADQKQETAYLGKLPKKVRDMYVQKALVYFGVKQLNYLAHSVHAENGGLASKYNLDILYRRQRRHSPDQPPAAAPATS